jgi:hypothetical protein
VWWAYARSSLARAQFHSRMQPLPSVTTYVDLFICLPYTYHCNPQRQNLPCLWRLL